jgi:hypothetical protein
MMITNALLFANETCSVCWSCALLLLVTVVYFILFVFTTFQFRYPMPTSFFFRVSWRGTRCSDNVEPNQGTAI